MQLKREDLQQINQQFNQMEAVSRSCICFPLGFVCLSLYFVLASHDPGGRRTHVRGVTEKLMLCALAPRRGGRKHAQHISFTNKVLGRDMYSLFCPFVHTAVLECV